MFAVFAAGKSTLFMHAALATDHTQRGVTGLELCKVSIFVFKLNV